MKRLLVKWPWLLSTLLALASCDMRVAYAQKPGDAQYFGVIRTKDSVAIPDSVVRVRVDSIKKIGTDSGFTFKRQIGTGYLAFGPPKITYRNLLRLQSKGWLQTVDGDELVDTASHGSAVPCVLLDQLCHVGADSAWALGAHGQGREVVIGGSGVDPNHSEFTNRIAWCRNYTSSDTLNCMDADCNGHETFVTSVAAGNTLGPAHQSPIGEVKISGSGGNCLASAGMAMNAIGLGIQRHAAVVNLSYCFGFAYSWDYVLQLAKDAGVVVVGANGNQGASESCYPAKHPLAVGVAAVDGGGNRPSWSNTDQETDFAADGVGVTGAAVGGGNRGGSGTSFSGPEVAGVIATGCSVMLSCDSTVARLKRTADTLTLPIPNSFTGYGRPNLGRMLTQFIAEGAAVFCEPPVGNCAHVCGTRDFVPYSDNLAVTLTTSISPRQVCWPASSGPMTITLRSL